MRTTCVLPAHRLTPQEYEGLLTGPSESPSDTYLDMSNLLKRQVLFVEMSDVLEDAV
jgi:hypothetical protein